MGTHPIFESDFDCLTGWLQGTQQFAAQTVWAMRTDKVYMAFEVEDAENVEVMFEKQKIHWLKVDFSRWRDEDDDEGEDKLDSDFDMNKMLNQLRIDENGKEKGIEDFDDLDDE